MSAREHAARLSRRRPCTLQAPAQWHRRPGPRTPFECGGLVFDATGQELGECKAFFERGGLHVLVHSYDRVAKFSDYSAIWRKSGLALQAWPLQALEPVFAWYALGEEGQLVVLRN